MKRILSRPVALGGLALSLGSLTAALTITPSRQDFGDVAVRASVVKPFQISLPTGARPGDTINVSFAGANPADFAKVADHDLPNTCESGSSYGGLGWRTGACVMLIGFVPKSIGVKTATLVISDTRGNRGTAALRGKGVGAICQSLVVFCNYAHLYTGVVRWNSVLRGPTSSTTIAVQVDVVMGRASCNGSETISDVASGSKRGDITGDGLIAVEFKVDDKKRLVYNITVACPSPSWRATATDAAIPSRPAELGDYEQQSYDQPAESVGMDLVGSNSYQDGAADPINNVDGTVTVSWSLKRS